MGSVSLVLLQWGRDQLIAEIGALLSYSIFKDLATDPRALLMS